MKPILLVGSTLIKIRGTDAGILIVIDVETRQRSTPVPFLRQLRAVPPLSGPRPADGAEWESAASMNLKIFVRTDALGAFSKRADVLLSSVHPSEPHFSEGFQTLEIHKHNGRLGTANFLNEAELFVIAAIF